MKFNLKSPTSFIGHLIVRVYVLMRFLTQTHKVRSPTNRPRRAKRVFFEMP
jgi:hypothetical protein